jgi:hypothetical protein
MIAFSYIRDALVINSNFVSELQTQLAARKVAPGATILIAARTIRHAPSFAFTLDGLNLVVAADEYDPSGGSIDVSGRAGANGAVGAKGATGAVNATGTITKPGGNGGNGVAGGVGAKGNALKIFIRSLSGGAFFARGGKGGNGGNGGNGGDGGVGKRVILGPGGGKITEAIGTDGGNGGNGGNGGSGGGGGQIAALYLKASSAPHLNVSGGAKGNAGGAGLGGKPGPESTKGKDGKPGVAGAAAGAVGTQSASVPPEAAFWAALRAAIGPSACAEWAAFRVRCGDYAYRSAAPPDLRVKISRAYADYDAAAKLDPSSPGANRRAALMAGHSPIGLRRDLYIVPDFPRYESAYTAYAPIIQSMLGDARDLLLQASNVGANKQRLIAERSHFTNQKAIVASELAEASLELTNAQSGVAEIDTRITAIKAQIKAKEKELEAARVELNGEFIGTVLAVIGAVAAVASACFTGGASLAALPGLLIAAEGAWSKISKDASGNLKYDDRPLADIIQWEGKDGKFSPTVKKEIQAEVAGLAAVVKSGIKAYEATLDLIDKVKVLDQLGSVTVEGGVASEHRALMQRSAQLHLDRSQAQTAVEAAKIRVQTVQLKDKQVDADIAAAQQLIDTFSADTTLLGRACRMIVRRAQEYMDILLRFHFFAARALEIYAYQDHTKGIDYALGWAAPDLEEAAYTRLAAGDAAGVLDLLHAYLTSWSKLPAVINLRSSYETYRQGLTTQSEFWALEGAAVETFRSTGTIELEVTTAALLGDPREYKIDGTSAALVGAAAATPFIPVVLVHGGASRVQLLDGAVINHEFAPRGVPLQAAKTEAAITQVPASPPEAFWGRSPATRWRLYIQPEALASVNLTGLTKIVIGVAYKALIPALGVRAGAPRS